MSQPFKIEQILTDEHWGAFHELVMDRGVTLNALQAWLRERGYTVCRGAIHNYRKAVRARGLFDVRQALGCKNDAQARQRVAAIASGLEGGDLSALLSYAAFLARVAAERYAVPTVA